MTSAETDHQDVMYKVRCGACHVSDLRKGGGGRADFLGFLRYFEGTLVFARVDKSGRGPWEVRDLDGAVDDDNIPTGRWQLVSASEGRVSLVNEQVRETLSLRCRDGHNPQVRSDRLEILAISAYRSSNEQKVIFVT